MNKLIVPFVALFALLSTTAQADVRTGFDGEMSFSGKGSIRTVLSGEVTISGKVEIVLFGKGEMNLTAGTKYRGRRALRWSVSDGSQSQGTAGLRVRLDGGQTAHFKGKIALRAHTRMGGIGKATLSGRGKVGAHRRWSLLRGSQNRVAEDEVEGELPPL